MLSSRPVDRKDPGHIGHGLGCFGFAACMFDADGSSLSLVPGSSRVSGSLWRCGDCEAQPRLRGNLRETFCMTKFQECQVVSSFMMFHGVVQC